MIFSILHISRDHFANLSSVVYCKKGHCFETVKFNGCTRERPQYSRDLFRAKTLANWLYCNLVCYVFVTDSDKINNGSV